jgi:hypothetical protein
VIALREPKDSLIPARAVSRFTVDDVGGTACMRKAELRLNDARDSRDDARMEQPSSAQPANINGPDHDISRRRAKRLGLALMAASCLVVIVLFGVVWWMVRHLL